MHWQNTSFDKTKTKTLFFCLCGLVQQTHLLVDVVLSSVFIPLRQKMCTCSLFFRTLLQRTYKPHACTKLGDSPGRVTEIHSQSDTAISCLILIYSFTCALYSNEAAIGLPVWLLSYYKTEVVSCKLCMIADSLNQGKRVSIAQAHTTNMFVHTYC